MRINAIVKAAYRASSINSSARWIAQALAAGVAIFSAHSYSSSNNEKAVLPKDFPLVAPPLPYDYALLSSAAYDNPWDPKKLKEKSSELTTLKQKAWVCRAFIEDKNGYSGQIWVNDSLKQVVIAHRGSQNIESWIEDFESVFKSEAKGFVESAIRLLSNPIVKEKLELGYRISTTGHSLGGFLAQILVFWSERPDFKMSGMSAVVFDSPGAADLMDRMQSNLLKERITLDSLNIQNYCAMPNIVNTFGRHAESLWRLRPTEEDVFFEVISSHSLKHILTGFDEKTGYPKDFRQMSNWPQAKYDSLKEMLVNVLTQSGRIEEASKFVLDIINVLYQKFFQHIGASFEPTSYSDPLNKFLGEAVRSFLNQTSTGSRIPDLKSYDKRLSLAIKAAYSAKDDASFVNSMDIRLFDTRVRDFIKEYYRIQNSFAGLENLNHLIKSYYKLNDRDIEFLNSFRLSENTLVLDLGKGVNIFVFQSQLYKILSDHPSLMTINQFPGKYLSGLAHELASLKHLLEDYLSGTEFLKELKEKVRKQWSFNRDKLRELKLLTTQSRLYLYADASKDELKEHELIDGYLKKELAELDVFLADFKEKQSGLNAYLKKESDLLHQDLLDQAEQVKILLSFNQAIHYYKLRRRDEVLVIVKSLIDSVEERKIKHASPIKRSLYEENTLLASLYNLRGKSYRALGDFDHCIESYKTALSYEPDNFTVLSSLGYLYNDLGEHKKACIEHRKAYELEPFAPIVQSNYGHGCYCYALTLPEGVEKKELLEKALGLFDASIKTEETPKTKKTPSTSYYERGMINLSLNKKEAARGDFDKCLSSQKDHPQCLLILAKIELDAGHVDIVDTYLTRASISLKERLNPRANDPQAKELFSQLKKLREDLEERRRPKSCVERILSYLFPVERPKKESIEIISEKPSSAVDTPNDKTLK